MPPRTDRNRASRAPFARLAVAAALATALAPAPARAERFDFIYLDRIEVRFDAQVFGFTTSGNDFGLIVNRDTRPFLEADLATIEFGVIASGPELRLIPAVNPDNSDGPILPLEAVGSVMQLNAVLPPLVAAGETYRNTAPAQFLYFTIARGTGDLPATVRFDVTMRMGDQAARMVVVADGSFGSPRFIRLTHAARAASEPVVTDAARSSWGRIKRLYR